MAALHDEGVPVPAAPRFDHVAVTVDRMQDTVDFSTSGLGFGVAGRLEVFTYPADTQGTPWRVDADTVGFRGVGFIDADSGSAIARLTDCDGFPIRIEGAR